MEVSIFLTNLAQYNNGRLVGKWVDLPLEEEDLEKERNEVLGVDEELFITDYSAPFRVEEYENISALNDFVRELEKLDERDQEKVVYLVSAIGMDYEDALRKFEDVIFYPEMDLEEVAEELVEEGLFGEISDKIKGYLDYERIGRDLSYDGYDETEKGTFCYS